MNRQHVFIKLTHPLNSESMCLIDVGNVTAASLAPCLFRAEVGLRGVIDLRALGGLLVLGLAIGDRPLLAALTVAGLEFDAPTVDRILRTEAGLFVEFVAGAVVWFIAEGNCGALVYCAVQASLCTN